MDKLEKCCKDDKRRKFIKSIFAFATTVGLISTAKGNSISKKSEKIKLLTPEGRLVEIDKSKIEKEIVSQRASNKDVQNWMSSKK